MNSRWIAGIATFVANILVAAPASNSVDRMRPFDQTAIEAELMRLPISFEADVGQLDRAVEYVTRARGFSLFLTKTEAVFVARQPEAVGSSITRMQFVGGAAKTDVEVRCLAAPTSTTC